MLNFEFYEDNTAVTGADIVFIPQGDLIGIIAGEFADTEATQLKENKFVYSLMNTLVANGLANALGLTIVGGAIVGQANALSSKTYTFTTQYYADLANQVVNVLPLPSIGDQVGLGDVNLTDLFVGAVKVASGATVSGEGMGIPSSLLQSYGSPAHASIAVASDSRDYISALMRYIVENIDVRDASTTSAITAKTSPAIASLALPAVATDATNPTTGIASADIPKIDTYSKTISLTIQRIENEATQSFDVNVVTA